MNNYPMSSI